MGSLPLIRGPQMVAGWYSCFPELEGRPQLIAAMTEPTRRAVSFRAALFRRLEAMHCVPFLPDDNLALHVLDVVYKHDKADFIAAWEGKVEKRAMCQAVSAIKEAHRMSVHEIRDRQRETRGKPPLDPEPCLFRSGNFSLAGGERTTWKIDCDALTDADLSTLAALIAERLPAFGSVEGVPRGGLRLAKELQEFATSGPPLIVDDVLTTGGSMERQREGRQALGAVIFARGACPDWIMPLFSLAQRRP